MTLQLLLHFFILKALREKPCGCSRCREARRCLYLLQHAGHVGVLAHGQTQRCGQSLLVLKTAGIELGPELHLQLAIFLLRELKLCHTALQLQDVQGDRRILKSALLYRTVLKSFDCISQNKLPHFPQLPPPPFSELPKTDC